MKTQRRTDSVSKLIAIALNQGFDHYGSFNEEDYQHEILLCNKGKYDGEVIDLYSEWYTGEILKVEYSCQTKTQKPTFTFTRFWDAQPILSCAL